MAIFSVAIKGLGAFINTPSGAYAYVPCKLRFPQVIFGLEKSSIIIQLEDFNKPKIVYGQFQDGAEYSFAEPGIFLSSNEYMLIVQNYSSKCLLAFLNSKPSEWLLSKITGNLGGNSKIGQKSNFLKLSIAILDKEQQQIFEKLVDEILLSKVDSPTLDLLINNKIYEIYGFSKEESDLIESQQSQ